VRADLDQRGGGHNGVLGEGADLGDVRQIAAVAAVVAEGAVGGHSGQHRCGTCIADVLHTRRTPTALTAHRDEGRHHVVAGGQPGDALAHLDDHCRALVTADRRRAGSLLIRWGQVALTDVFVGVAQTRGGHADQNLAGARRIELELLDRPGLAVGAQDRGAASHLAGSTGPAVRAR
jgi:hypothetical protein